ncbi:MAG: tetratricopeptide repeat-containing protein, partial [Vicinamibacterales bacterium]
DYYCAALASEDGAVTARDIEQWANLMGRLAIALWRRNPGDPEVTRQSIRDIRRSIYILKGMLGGHHGERLTTERLALIGSAYKRLAWVDREGRAEALTEMASHYRRGAERARQRGADSAYPLLNGRWAELAMRWQGVADPSAPGSALDADLAAVRAEVDAREKADGPQFWQDSMRLDCDLLEAMQGGTPSAEWIHEIAGRYLSRREYASAREFASVRDQVDFLAAMAEQESDAATRLADLQTRLDAGNA